jgi:hypothetical protein
MSLETRLFIAGILLVVVFWLLRNFFNKRVSAGQTLFWMAMLLGGMVLALFPAAIDLVSLLWGDLWPVSWITFGALVFLIFYLLYLTIRLNSFSKLNELVRNIAYLERRVREVEHENRLLRDRLSGR